MNDNNDLNKNNSNNVPKDIFTLVDGLNINPNIQNKSNNIDNINNTNNVNNTNNYFNIPTVERTNSLENATVGLKKINSSNDDKKVDFDKLLKKQTSEKVQKEKNTKLQNNIFFGVVISSATVFIIILFVAILFKGNIFSFKGNNAYYQDKVYEDLDIYQTAVVTDNIYTNVTVNNEADAKNLIIKDSNNQKNKCSNEDVKEIEKRMESNYGVTAVNLCEIDYSFALEIENVFKTLYEEFPNIKRYLTNITLINDEGYIANFVSAKLFAKSNTWNTYPNVYKMSLNLNSSYFLDIDMFSSVVEKEVASHHFPANATKSTLVAHEFGHYLSFLAQLNNSEKLDNMILLTKSNYKTYKKIIDIYNDGSFSYKIIKEAYDNYTKKNPDEFYDIDEFRGSISNYAVTPDDYGNYIYDETIAEAFHDYYINRNDACDASLEIVKVLKKYLNN
ncbi:MAG: hypothetical protein PUD59_00935 [bacterium]|nr:hypothetical protein [bacterium]